MHAIALYLLSSLPYFSICVVKLYSPLLKIEEVETSASFNITCSQYGYARDPTEVHFHKDGFQLDSDQDSRYEVLTITEAQQGSVNISTILMVQDARVNDSGSYTCSLQGAEDVNITVDVLPSECDVMHHNTRFTLIGLER